MVFGAVGGLLGVLEPLWSPSQLIRDVTERPLAMEMAVPWPTTERILISAAILTGMLVAGRVHFRQTEYQASLGRWVKHLLAGIVMGVGASLALGGNDLQLLIGIAGRLARSGRRPGRHDRGHLDRARYRGALGATLRPRLGATNGSRRTSRQPIVSRSSDWQRDKRSMLAGDTVSRVAVVTASTGRR